ncbi:unnamed protein product [Prunus armeniaca]|uniref:Uncharacterized protein n=1 Tax=Prunus armeniaca TaxID=36596 RepID=A0A6J5WR12_PRUAR|nr:unnamed protein product [Prunus armeniaca]
MAGLTSAGKTTILNKIHTEEALTEILTFGFSVEMLSHPYTSIAAFNVGGENIAVAGRTFGGEKNQLWDRIRFCASPWASNSSEFKDEWRDASVLLITNKNGLPDAMTIA